MNIFDFDNYKNFVVKWVSKQPKRGYGQFLKMAHFLKTSSTNISQVFNGDRHLTLEQAATLCQFFEFSNLEIDYFLCLVQLAKSGTTNLQKVYERQLASIREASSELKNRINVERKLNESEQALFYSQWFYPGIRNLIAVPDFKDVDSISQRLKIPRQVVMEVLQFLIATGLCIEKDGKYEIGPKSTHLGSDSLLAARNHTNWRNKGIEKLANGLTQGNLFFTSPMSLSAEDARQIQIMIFELIKEINNVVDPSPSEVVRCLNIDWFEY